AGDSERPCVRSLREHDRQGKKHSDKNEEWMLEVSKSQCPSFSRRADKLFKRRTKQYRRNCREYEICGHVPLFSNSETFLVYSRFTGGRAQQKLSSFEERPCVNSH